MKFTRTLPYWRFILFVSLIVVAPLSKYPSLSAPLLNFPSFRIGLYQLLAALFVVLCLKPIFLAGIRFFAKDQRYIFSALVVLGTLALASIAWSLYPARSALLGVSFTLLVAVLLSSWWFVATQLNKTHWHITLRAMLFASIVFGFLGVLQLIVFTFSNQTFGVLCPGCSPDIFGFPRINGLAAEPQFFANAMIPFVFASVYAVITAHSKLAWAAFVSSIFTIGITFSRGAYFAVGIALFVMMVALYYKKFASIKALGKIIVTGLATLLLSFTFLTISATIRYNDTPNIAYETIDSIFEHLSLGVINLPEKTVVIVQTEPSVSPSVATNTNQNDDFVSPGLIESSGNERLSAADLALKAWQYNPLTAIFGVGIGNLGPFVVENIDASAPENLTVYIYYILLIAELGVVGLGMFAVVVGGALVRLSRTATLAAISLTGVVIAFAIQFLFFGSYINVVYIWLWLGIALGVPITVKSKTSKVKKV